PELFLRYNASTRRVTTRPMKGTRPISADPEELRHAEKDRAELNMITDLMRNDLGRVCAFGSVLVDAPRTIEMHGRSVLQATSTVSGTVRPRVSHSDLIAATFPPGSVTGTPKIRAMQLIQGLEPTPRGFYCGAIGWLDDSGDMELSVSIRTAVIEARTGCSRELHYHAGAGIVADSRPEAEGDETMDKAEVLRRALS
ncbi:MAG: chorismate-binding protein, partial [Phycisphaerales bacterium]|nr:chorismate-binding protein [Phycisphaerales bacterium]